MRIGVDGLVLSWPKSRESTASGEATASEASASTSAKPVDGDGEDAAAADPKQTEQTKPAQSLESYENDTLRRMLEASRLKRQRLEESQQQ